MQSSRHFTLEDDQFGQRAALRVFPIRAQVRRRQDHRLMYGSPLARTIPVRIGLCNCGQAENFSHDGSLNIRGTAAGECDNRSLLEDIVGL